MGWDSDRSLRPLGRADFACTAGDVAAQLEKSLQELTTSFKEQFEQTASSEASAARAFGLDPTQKLVVDVLTEWAKDRLVWKRNNPQRASFKQKRGPGSARRCPTLPPNLRLLLLGTAGTGKTHTAKVAITEVRILLESYDSVVTMAFSGVASANLGIGSR